jgi:hypothetical protein
VGEVEEDGMTKDQDFYAWTEAAAACLRSPGELSRDLRVAIAEEIEDLGRSEERQVYGRLSLILMHMLKWEDQPLKRSRSWQHTLNVQRRDLARLLEKNHTLAARLDAMLPEAYARARDLAAAQTGLEPETFAEECPWSLEEIRHP